MSVIVKGMEMPKSCDACMFSRRDITNTDWCVLTEKNLPCDCPLIEVPPHGRLIDADAMIHDIEKSAPMCSSWYVKERNADMIKFLSIEDAVIPAEEGE